TTRKCTNCPAREAAGDGRALSNLSWNTIFKVPRRWQSWAAYRKALFRDRNQPIKQELFTLEPRPDALRVSSSRSIGRKFTLNALKLSNLGSFEPDNSDTFVSSPLTGRPPSLSWPLLTLGNSPHSGA